jgi:hypothetical protein
MTVTGRVSMIISKKSKVLIVYTTWKIWILEITNLKEEDEPIMIFVVNDE